MTKQLAVITFLTVACASLAFSGCDEGTVNLDADGGNICSELAEVMCHNTFECCSGKTRDLALGENHSDSRDQCLEDMQFACEYVGAEKLNSVDMGRVELDAEAAEACFELLRIDDQACYEYTLNHDVIDLCLEANLMIGTVDLDDSCFWNWECGDSAYCTDGFECVPLPEAGKPCAAEWLTDAACAEGLYCDYSNYECATLNSVGQTCNNDDECEESAYCYQNECTPKKAEGKTCRSDVSCETGFCPTGQCKTTGETCQANTDCPESCEGRVCTEYRSYVDHCKRGLYAPCTVFGESSSDCKDYFDVM